MSFEEMSPSEYNSYTGTESPNSPIKGSDKKTNITLLLALIFIIVCGFYILVNRFSSGNTVTDTIVTDSSSDIDITIIKDSIKPSPLPILIQTSKPLEDEYNEEEGQLENNDTHVPSSTPSYNTPTPLYASTLLHTSMSLEGSEQSQDFLDDSSTPTSSP